MVQEVQAEHTYARAATVADLHCKNRANLYEIGPILSRRRSAHPFSAWIAANTFFEHKIPNFFTAGPRLGYAWDRLMIFGTGGYASADLASSACSSVTGLCDQTRSNGQSRNNGWYAGGGFDYMVHKGPVVDVLLGVEYQHTI